jgi:uncharacterized membrane protein YbhN (UPF0104 family)
MTERKRFLTPQNLLRIFGSLFSIALLIYLISKQGWEETVATVRGIPVPTLLTVLGLMLLSRLAVSLRWYSLLHAIDPQFPYLKSLKLTFAGLFAANFLPTTIGGDVIRIAGVLRSSEGRLDRVTSIAADRLVGLAGMALVLPLGLRDGWNWIRFNLFQSAAFPTALLFATLPVGQSTIAERWERLRGRALRALNSLTAWLRRPRAVLTALVFTLIHMACLFLIISLFLHGMEETISFATISGLWSMTYFISLMPFSIAGLGIREVTITLIFQEVAGISPESALALAVLLRVLELIASLPGSLFIPGILASIRMSGVDG